MRWACLLAPYFLSTYIHVYVRAQTLTWCSSLQPLDSWAENNEQSLAPTSISSFYLA